MRHRCGGIAIALGALLVVAQATGSTPPTTAPTTAPSQGITVAVLDFSASDANTPQLGSIIGQTLSIMLANDGAFRLVDRTTIEAVLREQELNLSGLVETTQAIKVGKLVGARIIVVGKAFQLGQKLFITAKLIGTETTLVDGVLVKADTNAAFDELVLELATKVAQRLKDAGPKLVASPDAPDPLPALKAALSGQPLPAVAVVVGEQQVEASRPAVVPAAAAARSAAVETEIKRLLGECGVVMQDADANALAVWSRAREKGVAAPWPTEVSKADIVVTGEGLMESASRIGNLHTCAARAEINVIDRKTGKILYADRETTRAVDLSETLAGRTALQKAGHALGIRLLEHLRERTNKPAAHPGK
jgi:TolB-like protein